jgi:transposase
MEDTMPRPYSADLRLRVLRACAREEGTRQQIARRFRVSESTVYGWLRQAREEDRRRAKPHAGGRERVIDAAGDAVLRALVAEDNDATLAEYAAAFQARTGHRVSPSMVCKALKRLGLPRKKRRCGPASRAGLMWSRSGPPTAASWPPSSPIG